MQTTLLLAFTVDLLPFTIQQVPRPSVAILLCVSQSSFGEYSTL